MDVYDALLAPPDDVPPDPGLPDVIPEWVVCAALLSREPSCDCCGGAHVVDPGVSGLDRPSPESVLPPPSPDVQSLLDAVARVEAVDPTGLPGAQALVDAQALLGVEQRLRVLDLRRIGDVKARGLAELAGFTGASSWLRSTGPTGTSGMRRSRRSCGTTRR